MAGSQVKAVKRSPKSRQKKSPVPHAYPIQELLHSTAIFGPNFERSVGPQSLHDAASNAAGLHVLASRTLVVVKKLAKTYQSVVAKGAPDIDDLQIKEALDFLRDLRDDFGEVSKNAIKAVEGVDRGR